MSVRRRDGVWRKPDRLTSRLNDSRTAVDLPISSALSTFGRVRCRVSLLVSGAVAATLALVAVIFVLLTGRIAPDQWSCGRSAGVGCGDLRPPDRSDCPPMAVAGYRGSKAERGHYRGVVRRRRCRCWVIGHRRQRRRDDFQLLGDCRGYEPVGGEYVLDEFAPAPVDAAVVGTFGRQQPVEVPHSVAVAAVAGAEARSGSKVDLGAARALNDCVVAAGGSSFRSPQKITGLACAHAVAGLVAGRGKDRVEGSSAGPAPLPEGMWWQRSTLICTITTSSRQAASVASR